MGGTRQVNDYRKEIDPVDSKGIFERCCRLCPSLKVKLYIWIFWNSFLKINFKKANVEWEWAGLRPSREPTRVEKESYNRIDGTNVIVIHNYGHGGNGISLSRGTSVHAVNLLLDEKAVSKL